MDHWIFSFKPTNQKILKKPPTGYHVQEKVKSCSELTTGFIYRHTEFRILTTSSNIFHQYWNVDYFKIGLIEDIFIEWTSYLDSFGLNFKNWKSFHNKMFFEYNKHSRLYIRFIYRFQNPKLRANTFHPYWNFAKLFCKKMGRLIADRL